MTIVDDANSAEICAHCGYEIVRVNGLVGGHWSTPLGEPPAKGVALPIECPGKPVAGYRSTFGEHTPA
ncbi:hypothetical protein [Nonomuraea sediminis]|uniref:hypothetical protein n=1 Tax=Nonomuraea sediminis TaxID=2835864 RepID=UPI001BDCC822|nr:hypothetical protein [Nonomuraea sediminis]